MELFLCHVTGFSITLFLSSEGIYCTTLVPDQKTKQDRIRIAVIDD